MKKSEIRWQLELLNQHSEFYELIQDRILELLEKTDHENRLEVEEQEAEDQRAFHRELRDRLEAALHSVEANAMSKGIREQLEIPDETDALKGASMRRSRMKSSPN